jgi:hypothetical protein
MSAPTFICSGCFLTFQGYNTRCNICLASEKQAKLQTKLASKNSQNYAPQRQQSYQDVWYQPEEVKLMPLDPVRIREIELEGIAYEQNKRKKETIYWIVGIISAVGLIYIGINYWKTIAISLFILFALYIVSND